MQVTTLQALEMSIAQVRHMPELSEDRRRRLVETLQLVVVEECERVHARGGVIPDTLCANPC